jgi:hypothetical protein
VFDWKQLAFLACELLFGQAVSPFTPGSKNMFKKSLLSFSILCALTLTGSAAKATVLPLPDFTVNEGLLFGNSVNPNVFTADKIIGGYVEQATFIGNTFQVSLLWQGSNFYSNDGTTLVSTNTSFPTHTGLNATYGLYAFYNATGTVGADGSLNFTPGTGSLSIYLDRSNNTLFNNPDSGAVSYVAISNSADDVLIANGTPLSGQGNLNCSNTGATNCGSFGSSAALSLTNEGMQYFVNPKPFYNLTFQSGQFNSNFLPAGSVTLNGSLDVTFDVPEPGMVGLLGLGLLAATVSRRNGFKRKQS